MKLEALIRCNKCPRAHKIVTRRAATQQTVNFLCRCGNKITGTLNDQNWTFQNASPTELNEDEPVYVHEPELK